MGKNDDDDDGDNLRGELVTATVLLLVQLLGLLLGVVLGLLAVDKVQALGLDELVDLEAGGGGDQLLGGAVLDGLALGALLLLPEAHALEGGGGADELVGELGLVGLAVVDLVTSVLAFAWMVNVMLASSEWQQSRGTLSKLCWIAGRLPGQDV